MKKKIAIIGSTGSIGKTVLKIVKNNPTKFRIKLLTANTNYKELLKQTKKFDVENVIINNKVAYEKFKKLNKNKRIKIFKDFYNLKKIFQNKIDYSMSSIVGLEGLFPTLEIIKYTKSIAIANKESIICAWNLIEKELFKYKTKIIPVDSEHFSIWYSLNKDIKNIDKLILTASGGPLLKKTEKQIQNIKLEDVLKHPNWKMGQKISIDSSNLMNKIFEIIEARNFFKINIKNLDILIHPNSYVHAIIKHKDGMIKIVAHDTTMEIPIFNSIYSNNEKHFKKTVINLQKLNNLDFSIVNKKQFPSIKILNLLPKKISLFETVLVSANDELVRMYLNNEINYNDIVKKLILLIKSNDFVKYKKKLPSKISDVLNLDRDVRLKIKSESV
ncbi:1-deoxy-D-xylulose-5-phosphate reductoisomerase [Candidatus Pelagibacter sp. HIMB1542]|uniref:1-deoxy-D-xylulose-5-phosphate reductoisomerase n=1 Tax=Candidatus Pelagibacter sp. HIMB1542 TaxID=3413346 RepID=UPI003F82A3E7